jgi:phosphate starvation-inducible PhoH-like protein
VCSSDLLAVRGILSDIEGVAFVELDRSDVVRHRIVQDIVHAYERASERESDRAADRAGPGSW